jgi:hypothetical protein
MRYQHHKFNISRLSNGNHQNLFTYNSYILRIDIVHWKHIWNTELLEDVKSMWHLFIHRFVLHLLTRLSLCQACFQCMMLMCKSMNLWMNKLHMIFIINSSHVKFVMCHFYGMSIISSCVLWLIMMLKKFNWIIGFFNFEFWFEQKTFKGELMFHQTLLISQRGFDFHNIQTFLCWIFCNNNGFKHM